MGGTSQRLPVGDRPLWFVVGGANTLLGPGRTDRQPVWVVVVFRSLALHAAPVVAGGGCGCLGVVV